MRRLEDLRAFVWYLTTEPFRCLKNEVKNMVKGTTATVTNIRLWSEFLIIISVFSIMLGRYDFAIMFGGIGLFMRIYYEHRRKYYRHVWKQRRLNKLKNIKQR